MEEKNGKDFTPVEHTLTLPVSKKVALIAARELVGRDREQADIARLQAGGSQFVWFHALLSRVVTIDGKQLVPEDMSEMSTRDIDAISDALKGDERFFPAGGGSMGAPRFPTAS